MRNKSVARFSAFVEESLFYPQKPPGNRFESRAEPGVESLNN